MSRSERILVRVTAREKARIGAGAKRARRSVGELLRRAAESYLRHPDAAGTAGVVARIERSTARASRTLDGTLRAVSASQRRIAALEAAAPGRPATRRFTLERLRREQRNLERRLGRSLVAEEWLEALARGREPV